MRRQCAFRLDNGEPCRAAPLKGGEFCLMHSPEHEKEVQEARRLGGLRRKREAITQGAYQYEPITTIDGIRRIIEIAILDTLAMENSIARSRTLAYLAQVALRTFEITEFEERIAALEQAVRLGKRESTPSVFDADLALPEPGKDEKEPES